MKLFEDELCFRCKGRGFCGKPCRIYSKIKDFTPKTKKHFSGSRPPEIFVGRFNYPKVSAGILSPDFIEDTTELSMPEVWHNKNLSIDNILTNRSKLIYGKFEVAVKGSKNRFLSLMQEISMAKRSVSTEFFLKKVPRMTLEMNKYSAAIGNPAPLDYAKIQENTAILPKVDYLVSDTDAKSVTALNELYKSQVPTSNIIKVLSAGLLGMKTKRRLVPTRWAITAVDDTLSKNLLKRIKFYPEISDILVFHGYYVGNHYEFLLLPEKFSFEVIEAYASGSVWNPLSKEIKYSQDYEGFNGRKEYASNVTGAYYTARLVLTEYLERIKRQAYCIVFREERPEYYAPLGVGILRELGREAFLKPPERFSRVEEALTKMSSRLRIPIEQFKERSALLKDFGKQKKISDFF
jgi:DNA repair protein NreA